MVKSNAPRNEGAAPGAPAVSKIALPSHVPVSASVWALSS